MIKNLGELSENLSAYKGLTDDSRKVKNGYIFVAVKGIGHDGHKYIDDALKNGAAIVVGEENIDNENYLKVDDSREALGILASAWYGNPSRKLKIIGVTGTKGKTTTCFIIYHMLTKLGKKAGLVTSIAAKIGDREIDTGLHVTSPDVTSLHGLLNGMVDAGCEYAVIEVSSHGIDQKRIAGIKFDVGVLTNIAPEHLDYHKTFKEYKRVKMSFINSGRYKVISPSDTALDILPGKFNNLNVEAAIKALEFLGIDRESSIGTMDSFELPLGRLEEVKNPGGARIIVDFAHTPDSLEAVLSYLRKTTRGKLIAVFGCAGERDPGKRYKMGKISVGLADFSIFTAEDPRHENLLNILSKMARGARNAGGLDGKNFCRITERGEAISYALSMAKKGDTVAILGKGHERSMAFDGFEHPWSDYEIIENFLNKNEDTSAIILAAGKGTRMRSFVPKVLRKICGRPMIAYTLENLRSAGVANITAVISFKRNLVRRYIQGAINLAVQKNPKGGTADAARTGFEKVPGPTKVLIVINGDDSAFYTSGTIKQIIKVHLERERKLTFVSLIKNDPTGLGRVIRGENGLITKIVEEKDATPEEKKIKEVNDGLYVFDKKWFSENINKIRKSASGELYLVDLVKIAIDEGAKMATYTLPDDSEWQGINTPEELEKARVKMEKRLKLFNG